jgi:predicted PhzF superfamily epimerase YddE/YHI9
VVLDALGVDDATILGTAARVGYSETAFVVARDVGAGEFDVRYFSPEAEVPVRATRHWPPAHAYHAR